MQEILGMAIFMVVVIGAAVFAIIKADSVPLFFLWFFAVLIGCYIIFAFVGAILWIIAWIGIFFRDVLQWLIEAVLYPFNWILP